MLYSHFPRKFSPVLISEKSYSSSLSPNEKNNHLIYTASISVLILWSLKYEQSHTWYQKIHTILRQYFLDSYQIQNLKLIIKTPLCATSLNLQIFLNYPGFSKNILIVKNKFLHYLCQEKIFGKKLVAGTNEGIHAKICFPSLLSTSDKQHGWDRHRDFYHNVQLNTKVVQRRKDIISERSQIISGHSIDSIFTL